MSTCFEPLAPVVDSGLIEVMLLSHSETPGYLLDFYDAAMQCEWPIYERAAVGGSTVCKKSALFVRRVYIEIVCTPSGRAVCNLAQVSNVR